MVDNQYTLGVIEPPIDPEKWAPQDITDYNGHGTSIASLAGGVVHGVASKANLVIVKFRNAATNPYKPDDNTMIERGVTPAALADAWDWIIDDIFDQRLLGYTGKSVISISYGWFSVPFPNVCANQGRRFRGQESSS